MARKTKGQQLAERTIQAHLGQLSRHVETRGLRGVRRLYRLTRASLQERLRKAAGGSSEITPLILQAMLEQTELVLGASADELRALLGDVSSKSAELGLTQATKEYATLAKHFRGTTPVLDFDTPAVMQGLVENVDSSLLVRHRLRTQTWSQAAIARMEERMSIGAMSGQNVDELIGEIASDEKLAEERWRAERIVRTESAYAHGAGKQRAMQEADALVEQPLYKRLIETIDNRTGDDSFLLKGQTVPVDEPFTWKRKRGGGWVVEPYMWPPNRPNDRAVAIPWDLTWEDSEENRPLSLAELRTAQPTRWRKTTGVAIPPGHKPGKSYR